MKSFTFAAVAASLLLGVCVFMTGCGQSSNGNDKMGMNDAKMSNEKMSAMDDAKMAGDKMEKMSDGKMGDDKMSGGKMANEKMAGK